MCRRNGRLDLWVAVLASLQGERMMRIALLVFGLTSAAACAPCTAQALPFSSSAVLDSLALVVRVQSGAAPLGITEPTVRREVRQILSEAGVTVLDQGPPYLHVNLGHGVADCRDPASPVRPVRWDVSVRVSLNRGSSEAIWSDSVKRESAANSLRSDVLGSLRQVLFGLLSRR